MNWWIGRVVDIEYRLSNYLTVTEHVRITDVEADHSGYARDHEGRPIEAWFFGEYDGAVART